MRPNTYWRANLKILLVLLSIWALVSIFLSIVWVEALNTIMLFGFPLGFWFAQQGAIYIFVFLILIYCISMDRLEKNIH